MPHIFSASDIDPAINSLRFSVPMPEMAYRDPEISRFVERAVAERLPPSVCEVPGWVFPWFVPEALWNAPMWVHWLAGYDDAIDELAHTSVDIADHISTDLLKRRQVLCWHTKAHSFCTGAQGLMHGLNAAVKADVLSVFLSPTRFASTLAHFTEEDVVTLSLMHDHSGVLYQPHEWHTPEQMSAALMASVLLGNEPKTDAAGRQIVLLKKRALPRDWLA